MNPIETALAQYNEAEDKLHELFGYEQQWRLFPIEDHTEDWWMDLRTKFAWAEKPFSDPLIIEGSEHYSGEVYTYRHLKDFVFRAETHTMALIDTNCDGNIILMVFDNTKECTDKAMKLLYEEHW